MVRTESDLEKLTIIRVNAPCRLHEIEPSWCIESRRVNCLPNGRTCGAKVIAILIVDCLRELNALACLDRLPDFWPCAFRSSLKCVTHSGQNTNLAESHLLWSLSGSTLR